MFDDDQPQMMRTSEWRSLLRCPQQWDYAWNQGLQKRGAPADPLWFGTGIHIALAEWYCGPGLKRGPHPAETWEKYAGDSIVYMKTLLPGDGSEEQEVAWEDAKALGISMMNGYIDLYGADEHKLIISPEQKFSFSLPWGGKHAGGPPGSEFTLADWKGTFDGVWRHADTGHVVLDEHKTALTIRVDHLPLDVQGGGYWAVATRTLRNQGLIGSRENIRRIQYNFMRKALPDDRPRNPDGYYCNKPQKKHYLEALERHNFGSRSTWSLKSLEECAEANKIKVYGDVSKQQGSPLFLRHDVHRTSRQRASFLLAAQSAARTMQGLRSGLMPILRASDWRCTTQCDFSALCELEMETSGSAEEYKRLQFDIVDRYADHRKSTDE